MKLPYKDRLRIFWQETKQYVLILAVYGSVICGAIAYVESHIQLSEVEAIKIIEINAAYLLLMLILFTVIMFINGWASRLFGGEIFTSSISLLISIIVLIVFKVVLINYVGMQIEWIWGITILSTLILLAPYMAFLGYLFLLSQGDWRH